MPVPPAALDSLDSPSAGDLWPPQSAPAGLILDFGGVLFTTRTREDAVERQRSVLRDYLVRRVGTATQTADTAELLAKDTDLLDRAIAAAAASLTHFKHGSSRRPAPRELSPAEIVGEFYVPDFPDEVRDALVAVAPELLADLAEARTEHILRTGARELLEAAAAAGIPIGIASNAHSGLHHRRLLARHGLDVFLTAQNYSDEVGIRKPHPDMIRLTARALSAACDECWYVGDTLDRDVVAGRRAGVGAVILTRDKHTDNPPFPVEVQADAVLETPGDLVEVLRGLAGPDGPDGPDVAAGADGPDTASGTTIRALLIDHGGVISETWPHPQPSLAVAEALAAACAKAGDPVSTGTAAILVERARKRYREFKAAEHSAGTSREVTPEIYWTEFVDLTSRQREVVAGHADLLTVLLYRTRSRKMLRPGAAELLRAAQEAGVPVVMVSNTISGRGVRALITEYGLNRTFDSWVFSDEVGVKKPHPGIFDSALEELPADISPQDCLMVGDKIDNDMSGARDAGIGHRYLVRGGDSGNDEIADAVRSGTATGAVDNLSQLIALLPPTPVPPVSRATQAPRASHATIS